MLDAEKVLFFFSFSSYNFLCCKNVYQDQKRHLFQNMAKIQWLPQGFLPRTYWAEVKIKLKIKFLKYRLPIYQSIANLILLQNHTLKIKFRKLALRKYSEKNCEWPEWPDKKPYFSLPHWEEWKSTLYERAIISMVI